ncbi:MAG TPA: hypothetical protein VI233_09365 [Puia sp.]
MIEEIIEDLLLFIEPGISKDLNFEKGFQFLDKELAGLYPEPYEPANTKVVDKLVKIFPRKGKSRWLLLHLEFQGDSRKHFPGRMFEYFIRLYSKHRQPVAAIAILTGQDGKKRSATFEDRCLWTRVRYEYKSICITDYPDEVLAASNNPFAIVMLVAKEALLKSGDSDEEREKYDHKLLEQKLLMARLLKEKMALFGKKKTAAILTFLNNYVVFKKPETNRKFMTKTDEIFEKKNTMGFMEHWAEFKHQEGIQEGLEKGLEKGKELSVRLLLENSPLSAQEIAEKVGVSVTLVKKIKKDLTAK